MRRGLASALAIAAAIAFLDGNARANPLDTFGAGARAEGMAGAMTGEATGFAAAQHNPAGVALADDVEASIGYGGAATLLRLDGQDARATTPRGTTLGLAVPFRLGPLRVGFGLALYMPDQFLVRIQLVPASEPHFVLLDNNLDHLVVTPVLALAWGPLSVGAGVTLLADAGGNGVTFDVGVVGGQKVGRGQLDVSLPTRMAPVVGIRYAPSSRVRVGASYRGEIDLGLRLDVLARVDIAGAVTGDVLISLRSVSVYTPHKVTLGAAIDLLPSLTLTADLDWQKWSGFVGGVPDLKLGLNLSVSPSLVKALYPADSFHDTWTPRVGLEWRRAIDVRGATCVTVAARAGYAFEPTPVPAQTGLTSFADNDRHIVAVGAGATLPHVGRVLRHPLSLDVALQWHHLVAETTMKDPRVFPGRGFSSGGDLVHLAATLTGRF